MTGIVIIGAGECGVRAAFALRDQDYEGSITLVGGEDALPYERPPLSKDPYGKPKPIRPLEAYSDAGIKLLLNTKATELDTRERCVRLVDGSSIRFEKLLLATGARPRVFEGIEGCLTLRTDWDASVIRTRLASAARVGIIGGGFIGLELAASARNAGAEVTVIEAGNRLLGRAVPAEIASVVHDRHAARGVRLVLSTGVSSASDQNVVLDDGTVLSFDTVIAGVGADPDTALAAQAGLAVDNGIVVDGSFRTSDPCIFAAGDCCNFKWRGARVRLESWKAAQDQGAHAAGSMLGVKEPYSKVPWFWSDQYDLTLQVAGIFDHSRVVRKRATQGGTCVVFQIDNEGRLSAAAGIGQGNAVAKDLLILEKLIERASIVNAEVLADPSQNLKALLKAA